ncbi:HTH-type transcriptional repressor NsrR [Streptomyces griseoviridis]|uniref:HTH-type transcriptional repressor NsrR n=1 Tax=Streptomyces griseoviridis TaxID=45398 RepID=A0A918LJX8_STRGD|nr:HTH-type transcriptional repressor NsrR [Streptomyces niveoruber]
MGAPCTRAAKADTRLRHLGVAGARRGRGGGPALTALGRRSFVGRLDRELEGDGEVVECEGDMPCPLRAAFRAGLDPLTAADLVTSPTGPVLLGLTERPPP